MRRIFTLIAFFILLISTAVFAHHSVPTFNFFDAFLYGVAALIVISILSIHYLKNMTKNEKKAIFIVYVTITLSITIYMAFGTVFLNMNSTTGGPVHWHADFEIWICGQKLLIIESEGLDNKIGTPIIHHHNDYRIHLEGLLMHKDEASVGEFFRAIGGEFTKEKITVPLIDKTIRTWKDGDICPNEKPGKLRFFVNGKENFEFGNYIIAPYADVPPGDILNITFGD